jgi:hypothetical protein
MSPWEHYNKFGKKEKRAWPKVPPVATTPPPTNASPTPAGFLNYNEAVGRYLQDNQDVARAGMDPWQHYIQFGRSEGRIWPGEEQPALPPPKMSNPEPPPNPPPPKPSAPPPEPLSYLQAAAKYLQDNPDVARAGMNPWQHYIQFGRSEGRVWPGEEEPSFGTAY